MLHACYMHGMACIRCYAALGDVAKARYLGKVIELVDKVEAETVSTNASVRSCSPSLAEQGQTDGTEHYLVQAKLAILSKQFKQAEAILLERVSEIAVYGIVMSVLLGSG